VCPRAGLDAVVKKEIPSLPGLEPAIIQPVAQRYTTELFSTYHYNNVTSKIFQGSCIHFSKFTHQGFISTYTDYFLTSFLQKVVLIALTINSLTIR
jgi:hypothetical protein